MKLIQLALLVILSLPTIGTADSVAEGLFKFHSDLASQGDPQSMYLIGNMYETGRGVKKNYGLALEWYKKAADHGNRRAQGKIQSVSEKINKAVHLFSNKKPDNKKSTHTTRSTTQRTKSVKSSSNRNTPTSNPTAKVRRAVNPSSKNPPVKDLNNDKNYIQTLETRLETLREEKEAAARRANVARKRQKELAEDKAFADKLNKSLAVQVEQMREVMREEADANNESGNLSNAVPGSTPGTFVIRNNGMLDAEKKPRSSSTQDAKPASKQAEVKDLDEDSAANRSEQSKGFRANQCNSPAARFMSTCR